MAITAGSVYRLYINGEWVMDGPARAFSEYFFVDFLEFPEKYKTERIPEHLLRWMGGTESFNYGSNITKKLKMADELDRVQ